MIIAVKKWFNSIQLKFYNFTFSFILSKTQQATLNFLNWNTPENILNQIFMNQLLQFPKQPFLYCVGKKSDSFSTYHRFWIRTLSLKNVNF